MALSESPVRDEVVPDKEQATTKEESHDGDDGASPQHSGGRGLLRRAHVAVSVALLFTNYFLSQYDKFILSYFQASVVSSLDLTPAQYGMLSGYATGIVYAALALPVAFVADWTRARVWTLAIASAWWSVCVVCQGLAHDFAQVYCARLGMGIGQAAVEALSVSLISDLVGNWRDVFIGESVFYVGVYVGEAISGQIATSFTSTGTSWQVAMRAIGIAGVVVAVLLRLVLREPRRRKGLVPLSGTEANRDSGEVDVLAGTEHHLNIADETSVRALRKTLAATVAYLVRMHSFWLLLLSAAMRQLAGNVFGYYMPGYLSSIYPGQSDILSRYGIIVGVAGSASVLGGGLLTSLLWSKTRLTPIYLTSIGGMVSSIFVLLMIFSKDLAHGSESEGVVILYGVMTAAYLTAETWLGCLFALVALLLPPAYKTFGLAIWGSVQVLVYSSGPEIIGLALRNSDPGSDGYNRVTQICLAAIIVVGYWACGVGLLFAVPLVKEDMKRDLVEGPLSLKRRISFWASGATLIALVVVLFVLSIVYGI